MSGPGPAVEPFTASAAGAWTDPGRAAGPFQVERIDGSVATCAWYRFVDKPSLQQ